MARQNGLVNLVGSLGGLSYYKTAAGFFVRKKGGIEKKRMMTDPVFLRARQCGAEFGRASKAGKLMRRAFHPLLQHLPDNFMTGRLTREMLRVVKTDPVNSHGQRNIVEGDMSLLQGFEFNPDAPLSGTFDKSCLPVINRETGAFGVSVLGLNPRFDVRKQPGATHLKFVAAASQINFREWSHDTLCVESGLISIGPETAVSVNLSGTLTMRSDLPCFLVFGIEYWCRIEGTFYRLNNGEFNSLSIVLVSVRE